MDWFTQRNDREARPTRANARPHLSEITDQLMVGEYLRPYDIPWLAQEHGVTAIHNLQDDEDLRINALDASALHDIAAQHRMRYVRTPIQDGSADDVAARLTAALADLATLIKLGDRVYLHCNAGLNRAPTLAIAWLRAHGGMSLNEALAHVKRRRACGPFMTVLEDHFGSRDHKPAG